MRRLLAAAAVSTLVAASAVLGAGTAAAADVTEVYAVHGVPGVAVDVYVDGAEAVPDFQPLTVAGPLDVPSGSHTVSINAAGDSAAVASVTADLPAGASLSVVAHLVPGDQVALTPFVNDISPIAAGQTRLVVRHAANAPAVDIRAGGKVVAAGVTEGQQAVLNIPAGTVTADVVLAGTSTVVIGPADLSLAEGTATFVHAVGSADKGNLGLVSFNIPDLGSTPGGVPAGSGPNNNLSTTLVVLLVLGGFAAVAVGGRKLLAQRAS